VVGEEPALCRVVPHVARGGGRGEAPGAERRGDALCRVGVDVGDLFKGGGRSGKRKRRRRSGKRKRRRRSGKRKRRRRSGKRKRRRRRL
jgi:hypothetical protein